MPVEHQVPDDDPMMIDWKAHQQTEEYANTRNWYGKPTQDPEGILWAEYVAGHQDGHWRGIETLGRALRKFSPDIADQLIASYREAEDAPERFLKALRGET